MQLCDECLDVIGISLPENSSSTYSEGRCQFCQQQRKITNPLFYLILTKNTSANVSDVFLENTRTSSQ